MLVTFLTKSTGVLGPIAGILGLIMNGIYEFFYYFHIQNIALSIFVFTFLVKTLMLPLTIKQQKFTKLSSRMNPELQKIQAKYKGKKDEASVRKMQAEQQAVYQKFGSNPTSGCLPILITLPIMFALYSVINNIPAYVPEVKNLYVNIAQAVQHQNGYVNTLTTLAKGLRVKANTLSNLSDVNNVINVLGQFGTEQWTKLSAAFPSQSGTISHNLDQITKVNNFLGLNITNAPGWKFPGIIIPVLAMVLQFIQGKQIQVKNKDADKDNPAAQAMNSMNVVMPIMSGFFCVTFPIGVGLYWIATSVYTIIQQFFVNKYMDRIDIDELIEKSVKKANKKRATVGGASLQELANRQTKSIDTMKSGKENNTKLNEDTDQVNDETESSENKSKTSSNPNSISDIANLLKNRNSEKGDK